jgi:protein-S-isoprenylcysteine O-methyltransferase Ste14
MKYVIAGCWLTFFFYWAYAARGIKPTQETRLALGGWSRVVQGLLALLFFAGLYAKPGSPLALSLVGQAHVLRLPATLLTLLGLAVALWARVNLARNWSREPEFKQGHELITTGPYRYLRHPIYSAMMLMVLGTALFTGRVVLLVAWAVLCLVFWYRSRLEEALLTAHFPDEYPAYKQRTKALIPFLW